MSQRTQGVSPATASDLSMPRDRAGQSLLVSANTASQVGSWATPVERGAAHRGGRRSNQASAGRVDDHGYVDAVQVPSVLAKEARRVVLGPRYDEAIVSAQAPAIVRCLPLDP